MVKKQPEQDVTIDLEPMFADGQDFATPFEVKLAIDVEGGTPFDVTLTGIAAVNGNEKYVHFDTLADGDTPIGRIQREWARLNELFIVDRQKVMDTMEMLETKATKEAKNVKQTKS